MTDNTNNRRSWMIVSAHDAAALARCADIKPDVVVLDLEYTVPPKAKAAAREGLTAVIQKLADSQVEVFVRIDRDTRWADVRAAVTRGIRGIVFPGADSTDEVAEVGELITAISFPIPKRAAYAKFKQPASRFALVGVFVADTGSGVHVAVTGAGNGVFRHAGLEAALSKSFTPQAVEGVSVDASNLNSDLHASAAYRAHLIKVQTQRAVQQAMG